MPDDAPESAEESPEDDADDEEKDPVQAIFDIIDKYYEGLEREDEGMGVD